MSQYRLDDHRVFDAVVRHFGNDLGSTATDSAGFHRAAFGSMFNTRFSLCAQVMATWRCAGVCSSWPSAVFWQPLPRFAGVTRARCLLFGWSGIPANTPWNRVRLTLGLGTNAASLAIKSTGSKITCREAAPSYHPDTGFSAHSELCPVSSATGVSLRSLGG